MTWHKANKHSFNQSFPAGRESDGRQLFITQTMHGLGNIVGGGTTLREIFDRLDGNYISVKWDGADVSPDAGRGEVPIIPEETRWHIGKAGTHLRRGVAYSYGGKEYDSTGHYVYAPSDPDRYHWVAASNGSYPPGAIGGWNFGERQIVARMAWSGGIHPGKLIPSSGACYIGYGGGEKALREYEVLVRRS